MRICNHTTLPSNQSTGLNISERRVIRKKGGVLSFVLPAVQKRSIMFGINLYYNISITFILGSVISSECEAYLFSFPAQSPVWDFKLFF